MKTREELNALKAEFENVRGRLAELTEEEMKQVTGGCIIGTGGFPFAPNQEAPGNQTLNGLVNSSRVIQEREGSLGYGWLDSGTPE